MNDSVGNYLCPCDGRRHDPGCLYYDKPKEIGDALFSEVVLQGADSGNWFTVHYDAERDLLFTTLRRGAPLNKAMALNLAAWIIMLTDPEQKDLGRVLKAINQT